MIIKLIERQTRTTSNFGGLVRYLTDPQGKEHRVGEVRLMNYDSSDVADALQETKLTQAKNERAESADTLSNFTSRAIKSVISNFICLANNIQVRIAPAARRYMPPRVSTPF